MERCPTPAPVNAGSFPGQALPTRVRLPTLPTCPTSASCSPLRNGLGRARDVAGGTGIYGIRVQVRWGVLSTVLDWFLSSMLVVVIAAFLRVAFWFVDESQGLVRRRNKVIEQVAQEDDVTHVRH